MFRMYAFLSVAHTNTECATTLIVDGRSISLLFIFFPLIKPGEEAPALQSILLTQPPHPQFPVGGVFLAACHSPATVPSATCDSSSTWPPCTPAHLYPNPLQACFPPDCLRTPHNKLGTLVMFLLAPQPATQNDYLGGMHTTAPYDAHGCISVRLNSHSVTHKRCRNVGTLA